MSKKKTKKVRPAFLIAMGIALAAFGLVSGIALDLAMRPPERSVATVSPPPQAASPTREEFRPEQPFGEPSRAWAPESAPAKPTPPLSADAPLVAFAMKAPTTGGRPVIAVVIDDVGVDRPRALRMIDVPGPLTLSLMTYAEGLPDLSSRARKAGHEVMAHLPMEPLDPNENPGRGALRVNMDPATIRKTLASDLDPWSGYVGINNHMGSKFTGDRARMDVVMAELKARGLLWLDSKTSAGSTGTSAARAAGVPFVERDVFIDNEQTVDAVLKQLGEAERIAKARGTAIAIGHPHDATREALLRWLPQMEARGIALVPVTEILRRRTSQTHSP